MRHRLWGGLPLTGEMKCAIMGLLDGVNKAHTFEFLSVGTHSKAHFILTVKGDGVGFLHQSHLLVNSAALELSLGKPFSDLVYVRFFAC